MSIFDHPDVVPTVPTWRCPHCRTLQPEASRCRACRRAAVTCSTCHLYRGSVASDLAYCARDRTRSPLSGDEVRPCWEATAPSSAAPGLFDDTDLDRLLPSDLTEAVAEMAAPSAAPPGEADVPVPGRTWPEVSLPGRLVDAPHVAPGRRLMSEMQRRSRRSRGD